MGRPSTARQRLLDAACLEFSRVGAQAIGVDEICRLAGVNKGSFYHFFPSKVDLLLVCLEVGWEHLRATVLEPAFDPEIPPEKRITSFFDRFVKLQEDQWSLHGAYFGCLYCSLGSEIGGQIPAIRETVLKFMDRNLAYLSNAYTEAAEHQPLERSPMTLAENTFTLLLGALLEVKLRQEIAPLHRAKQLAGQFLQ